MSVLKIKDENTGEFIPIPSIKGDTGDAAGFGTVTATVDANHGTPSVTVTASGEDTAKNFAFEFKNLQPAPYDDSELQNDFAVLQGQFDTAVSAVTTDTEVTDIRVGADGVTDTTAGASVRRQFTDLKSDLNLINSTKATIPLDGMQIVQGSYNSSGEVTANSTRIRTSGFLNVKKDQRLHFSAGTNIKEMFIGYFTESGAFIRDGQWWSDGSYINIEANGKIILVFRNGTNSDVTPSDYDATTTLETPTAIALDYLNENVIHSDNILFSGAYTVNSSEIIRGSAGTHGEPTSATTVIRAKGLYYIPKGSKFVMTPGTKCVKVLACLYDLNRQYVSNIPSSWQTASFDWVSQRDGLYAFLFSSAGEALFPEDYDAKVEIFTKEYETVRNLLSQYNAKKRQNAVAYVGGNNIDWSISGSNCTLTIGAEINIRTNTGISDPTISISKASILSAASDYESVTVSGDTITGNAFCIYYDFDTNSINVANTTNANCYKNTCILFLHHWGSVTTGEIVRSVLSKKVKTNEASISSLDSRVSILEDDALPSYLADEAEACAESLVEACDEKSLVIAFNTDNHYGASNGWNWHETIGTIKKVNSLYHIDVIINGGDLINGDETKAKDVERLNEMISDMSKVKDCSYATIGNHDDGSFTISELPFLSQGELFSTIARHMSIKSDAIAEQKSYCYKDFDALGLRLIILDSHITNGSGGATPTTWGYDTDQINWLSTVALNTNNQVIIFSHMGVSQEFSAANIQPVNGVAVRTAIESFIANGGVVVGFFHGHTHWDFIGKHSNTNGFYEVSTGCSRIESGPAPSSWYVPTGAVMPVREAYTVTQELWDLIVIKPKSKKVKMIRFGAGDDREFTY